MTKATLVELLRRAIATSIPDPPAQFDQVDPKYIYVPPRHRRALDPNGMLVAGMRGAGKSFWWYLLQQEGARKSYLQSATTISIGFGPHSDPKYPDRDELDQLIRLDFPARLIWRAVLVRQLDPSYLPAATSWPAYVAHVREHPSDMAKILRQQDAELSAQGVTHIMLFDALDRTAEHRKTREALLAGALQLVLELRSFAALRAKIFARPDMLEAPAVRSFPDASKVLASAVHLDWRREDLYGLLFQYLGNAADPTAAAAFRSLAENKKTPSLAPGVWAVPEALREDPKQQKTLFEAIAGPYMGTDARRGRTYTWVPNHLEDGLAAVSPRSFLAAIRKAGEEPTKHHYALHWTGIEEGVRHASTIRADEIREDLPWAHDAMSKLKDLVVPNTKAKIRETWKKAEFLAHTAPDLPSDYDDAFQQLQHTGIFKILPDGRINIPDVYRLGFGLRRRGGFAPRR